MMYLQGDRALTPLSASLLLVPDYPGRGCPGTHCGATFGPRGVCFSCALGLALQIIGVLIYAQLTQHTALIWVVVASIVNGIGSGGFFPSNNAAVMKGAPPGEYGVASGMLRTFANIGMVMSFALAILMASTRIPRGLAFAIFVGTTRLSTATGRTFIAGLHLVLYLSVECSLWPLWDRKCPSSRPARPSKFAHAPEILNFFLRKGLSHGWPSAGKHGMITQMTREGD